MAAEEFSPTRLRELREAVGMDQRQAAEEAGISRATLQNAESGRNRPHLDVLTALAHVYGVHPGEFFHEPDATPAANGAGQVEPVTP